MAGLLDDEYAKKEMQLLGLLSANAGGGSGGAGGQIGFQNIPLSNSSDLSANINGYYGPGNGLSYGGWEAEYKKRFGDKAQQELMLRYGQDQQQTPNYGIQYKYNW